ncbi:TIGR04222 domain-containing membrane protein [Sphingomonas sp. BT-65]|uniref:TIGR04222 domain-containing membrane protein n=1 Tax=Sphingomonas sp. BT-65 TaxID=2989821 RepID=UPI0022361499|nr:TIGR04222 domain-containing membrane protein [Sphingomonas sp. BT-65]MCW4461536.1 TIGR04222 domain-containing membrane protein [Sphingomonas sp. BT-65]
MSLGPFDWTGGPFLTLYAILLVIVVIAGIVIPIRLLPEGRSQKVRDPDSLAYLAGGRTRFADGIITRLLAGRALAMNGKNKLDVLMRNGATPVENSVLALSPPLDWPRIERTLRPAADTLLERLRHAGLMLTGAERANLRYWALLPYLTLLMFGATKWFIGDARERPVGFLTLLLIVTAVLALIRAFSIARLTRAGREALSEARTDADRIRRAPLPAETGLAVALFGTAVLAGSEFDAFHKMRAASGDGGSSGGGDGGGDGGCGGGGCGGCGS